MTLMEIENLLILNTKGNAFGLVKINDEKNKLISSDSESQDVKINAETNKLISSDSEFKT
jgi:hypothetical protein